jgi:CHAT domain-containing protein
VAVDDVLHAVPLDALPYGDGRLMGDHYEVELRSTLREILWDVPDPTGPDSLVVLGGASFFAEPEGWQGGAGSMEPLTTSGAPSLLRSTPWEVGFDPLPFTHQEALAIAALYGELRPSAPHPLLLEQAKASRQALIELAPCARWLHLATHAWFASEGVASLADPQALGARGFSPDERVRGTAPMALCGLALAGANRKPDALGRRPGRITAEELAALDLSNCELAVLSACDTNVGVRRAGQGVASLQRALHMAGVRKAITSLWKVPDEATSKLMASFYRRIWYEKMPERRALWEAKMELRAALDAAGQPLYSTRDWAGWVLSGG